MRILITGANGMLGTDLKEVFNNEDLFCYDKKELDITNKSKVFNKLGEIDPEYVINASAYTQVEKAESEKDVAFKVNATAVKFLAEACKATNSTLIHISTDYVFDGKKKEGYNEDDKKNPINVYGLSKSQGEDYVIKTLKKYCIIRTSWLFGKNGENFVKKIINVVKLKKEINVVNDQFGKPTYTKDLARAIKNIIGKPYGIYHITNEPACSWFDFAKKIIKLKKLNIKINPIITNEFKENVKRPKYSILINNKSDKLRNFEIALKEYLSEVGKND